MHVFVRVSQMQEFQHVAVRASTSSDCYCSDGFETLVSLRSACICESLQTLRFLIQLHVFVRVSQMLETLHVVVRTSDGFEIFILFPLTHAFVKVFNPQNSNSNARNCAGVTNNSFCMQL